VAPPQRTFAHSWWIVAAAVVGLAISWIWAIQDPIPAAELDLTRWINDAPDWLASLTYPVMQLGTVWAPVLVGLAILVFRRDWLLATATVLTGVATWFAAQGGKAAVERGRPLQYLPGVDVREGSGTGYGYISGHSAVAAATAVLAAAALPRRWRPLVAVLAFVVGIARIIHGVHLPADVIGGWSFGALLGLGAVTVVDRLRRPRPVAVEAP
jgi:undecaprenyl-diphosphatase